MFTTPYIEYLRSLTIDEIPDALDLAALIEEMSQSTMPAVFNRLLIATMVVTIVAFCCLSVGIIRRRIHGQFPLFTFETDTTGTAIVPHAIDCFALCHLMFATTALAFCALALYAQTHTLVKATLAVDALSVSIWIPVYLACFFSAMGCHYAVPKALQDKRPWYVWPWLMQSAWHRNAVTIGVPLLVLVAILPPTVLAGVADFRCIPQIKGILELSETVNYFEPFTEEQLAEIMDDLVIPLWVNLTMAKRYTSIASWVWIGLEYPLVIFYAPILLTLVGLLVQQVANQRARANRQKKATAGMTTMNGIEVITSQWRTLELATEERALARALRTVETMAGNPMPETTPETTPETSPESTPFGSPETGKLELHGEVTDAPFQGHGISSTAAPPAPRVTFPQTQSTPTVRRLRYLRRRVISVIALNVGLVISGLVFSVLAFFDSISVYNGYKGGPTSAHDAYLTSSMLLACAVLFFFITTSIPIGIYLADVDGALDN